MKVDFEKQIIYLNDSEDINGWQLMQLIQDKQLQDFKIKHEDCNWNGWYPYCPPTPYISVYGSGTYKVDTDGSWVTNTGNTKDNG